ncbi:hypothetical protein VNI00_002978 [Paramarasmius palmivorus]|uniref:Uncharacterized protein n=1 Tax=Paramarasmius palmivorus TaxID=297713 RepID=A0AAW0DWL5_9AGAR
MSVTSNSSRSTHGTSPLPNPRPAIYKIINVNSKTAIDLSGTDGKSVTGHTICNVRNPSLFLSITISGSGSLHIGSSAYPTSWEMEVFDIKENTYRIRWPNTSYVFDLRNWGDSKPGTLIIIKLDLKGELLPIHECQLWRFIEVESTDIAEDTETQSEYSDAGDWQTVHEGPAETPPASNSSTQTLADTVIDAEGLRVGGNGEIAITTTTTTVTTTVTRVKRLNVG